MLTKISIVLNYRHRQKDISIPVRSNPGGVKATQLRLTPLAPDLQVSEEITRRLHLNELLLNSYHRRVICARAYEPQYLFVCFSFSRRQIHFAWRPYFSSGNISSWQRVTKSAIANECCSAFRNRLPVVSLPSPHTSYH